MAQQPGERTIKCTLQYNGTRFAGFQRQGQGERTVQGELEEALRVLTGVPGPVVAAGRTDAGVHAHGQVIHFRTRSRIPTGRWPAALNSRLPADVVVVAAEEAPASFHARFDAVSKTYRYSLWNAPVPSPFWRDFSWWVREPLDVGAMREAAGFLVGRHDFAAFAAAGGSSRTTTRTVFRLDVEETRVGPWGHRLLHIWVEGDGFLYRMVRNIVGTLVPIGLGVRGPGWAREVLEGRKREGAGATAPPQGLTLWRVVYPDGEGNRPSRWES